MMGWMMGFGWLAAILVVVLLIAGIIFLVRMLAGSGHEQSKTAGATAPKVVLVVLAVIGGIALVGVAAMAVMHGGMMN
jgi:hypothetical protein